MTKDNNRSFLKWLLIFGSGLAIGILTAPKTGKGARAWVGQKTEHLQHNMLSMKDQLKRRTQYEQGRLTGVVHKISKLTTVPSQAEYVDDDLITQRVRTQIGEHRSTGHISRINVDTANRVVTLRGRVDSHLDKQNLEQVTNSVPDVEGVVNKVTISRGQAAGGR